METITTLPQEARDLLPEGFFYIGRRTDIYPFPLYSYVWTGTEWLSNSVITASGGGSYSDYIAIPINHTEAKDLAWKVFYHLMDRIPPVPEGYVIFSSKKGAINTHPELVEGMDMIQIDFHTMQWGAITDQMCSIVAVRESQVTSGEAIRIMSLNHSWLSRISPEYNPRGVARSVDQVIAEAVPALAEIKQEGSKWMLLFNGVPMSSISELIEAGSSSASGGALDSDVVNKVWEARNSVDPEGRIEDLIDIEPMFICGLEYIQDVQADGMDLELIGKSGKSIPEIIVKATAGILLKGELSDSFAYMETGEIVVNPDKPPSLDQGNELLTRILQVKETGQRIENYSAWTLGMICDLLQNHFGDRFDPSMVMTATNTSYNTYTTSLNVFRNCWANRRQNLSFTHHKEVFYADISEEDKEKVLDLSEKLSLSVAVQRKVLSYARTYGMDSVEGIEVNDCDDLMTLITVRSVNRNYMFYMPTERKWYRFRGPYESIPSAATTVIDIETKAVVSSTGPVSMDVWTPAERPAPERASA